MPFKMQWKRKTTRSGSKDSKVPSKMTIAPTKRCTATKRDGNRCSIDSNCSMFDAYGNLVCEPLKRGGSHCRFHMSLFENKLANTLRSCRVFYIDFETTGLDVLSFEILEIGVTEALEFFDSK